MTMACSPDPGTAAAAWDHLPCDVAVYSVYTIYPDDFFVSPNEFVSLTDNLRRAGLRVENGELCPLFSRYPTPARVIVIIVSQPYIITALLHCYWRRSFASLFRSGVPVIPVYWDVGPDEVQDKLEFCDCLLGGRMKSSQEVDFCRRLLTISGHDLARYDGNKDELKMGVLCEVSKVVNTHRIAEANELISQNHIYKKRVSVSEEIARHGAELAVSHLKLLAGELLKHAMDRVDPSSSYNPPHSGPSSKFRNRAHRSEVRRVAMRLSMKPREFARKADRCIDGRNKVAHFLTDKDWRKNCADAVQFINRYPDVKTVIPVQCDIILAHEDICDEFRL